MSAPIPCNAVLTAHDVAHLSAEMARDMDRIALPYEGRLLRRKKLQSQGGVSVLLDLAEVTNLEHGGALHLTDGRYIGVEAAPEQLLAVSGPDLPRLAWHIGNRHTPCQIEADRLLILHDHVLADMLAHLGAQVVDLVAPFTPEGGAYGHGRTFGHSHGPADHAGHEAHSSHSGHAHASDHSHSHES